VGTLRGVHRKRSLVDTLLILTPRQHESCTKQHSIHSFDVREMVAQVFKSDTVRVRTSCAFSSCRAGLLPAVPFSPAPPLSALPALPPVVVSAPSLLPPSPVLTAL
jgi:hypothetical protein